MNASLISIALLIGIAANIAAQSPKPPAPANWKVTREKSPIDDSEIIIAKCVGSTDTPFKVCTLILRWKEGEFDVYLNADEYLGPDDLAVTTRLGSKPAYEEYWSISGDHKGAFHPLPAELLQALLEDPMLILRYTPFADNPVTFQFDTAGLRPVAQEFLPLIRAAAEQRQAAFAEERKRLSRQPTNKGSTPQPIAPGESGIDYLKRTRRPK